MERMLKRGVATRRGVMAIHESSAYKNAPAGYISLPVTEAATRETLLLPIYTTLVDNEQEYVVETLKSAMLD